MMRCPPELEMYRQAHPFFPQDRGDASNGLVVMPHGLVIMFGCGEGWEHVSVSLRDRCPTWEEMAEVARHFWESTDTVMQLHVPPAEHKNFHPYCLHLWRPLEQVIPRPPSYMVA